MYCIHMHLWSDIVCLGIHYILTRMVVLSYFLSKILAGKWMSLGPWGFFRQGNAGRAAWDRGSWYFGPMSQCVGHWSIEGFNKRLRKSEENFQDLHVDTVGQREPKQKHMNCTLFIWMFAEDLIRLTCLSRSSRFKNRRSADWVAMCLHRIWTSSQTVLLRISGQPFFKQYDLDGLSVILLLNRNFQGVSTESRFYYI